jgi:hypothetical protein
MARRGSGFPSLLLVIGLVLAALFLYNRVVGPGLKPKPWAPRLETRRRERRSPDREREPFPESRDRSYAGHRGYQRREGGGCGEFDTTCESQYFGSWMEPGKGSCRARISHGYPVPDPRCTPGGFNPSVSEAIVRDPAWRTRCVRNCQSSEAEKHVTYGWYRIHKPKENSGENQVCELDHLIPLELGGADGLGNIWPECGPASVSLDDRYFKVKDRVENYLADEVKAGRMPLAEAQRGIAQDWTQYLEEAKRYCAAGGRC